MLGLPDYDLKGKASPVRAGGSGSRIGDQLALLEIPERSSLFVAISPAADSGHEVIRRPVGEGVIGCVNHDKPSAVADELLELQTQILRPAGSIVVQHNHLVMAQLRPEPAEVSIGRRGGDDSDLKEPGLLELRFQHRSRQPPIVPCASALSIQKKHPDRS